ncbi:hypothetical protein D3C77_501870 [compost metagenome]
MSVSFTVCSAPFTISSSSSRSLLNLAIWASSSSSSTRSRSRVMGVLRSWEMELNSRSLSSMKRRMRCCMMLKARVAATISEAPSSLREG